MNEPARHQPEPLSQAEVWHVLLTRFNVPFSCGYPGPFLDEDWLAARVQLFEKFCLPSVTNQTCTDFTWLIFCHIDTPHRMKRVLEGYGSASTQLVWTDGPVTDALVEEHAPSDPKPGLFATTRLDSDDALALDFVERLQAAISKAAKPSVINFLNGYQWSRQELYWLADPSNPFATLVDRSPSDGGRTVLTIPHEDLPKYAPLTQIRERPTWMQVVHDGNFANRVVGLRVTSTRARRRFVVGNDVWPRRESSLALLRGFVLSAVNLTRRVLTRRSAWRRLASLLPD